MKPKAAEHHRRTVRNRWAKHARAEASLEAHNRSHRARSGSASLAGLSDAPSLGASGVARLVTSLCHTGDWAARVAPACASHQVHSDILREHSCKEKDQKRSYGCDNRSGSYASELEKSLTTLTPCRGQNSVSTSGNLMCQQIVLCSSE